MAYVPPMMDAQFAQVVEAPPQMQMMQVNCPAGAKAGSMVTINTPSGQQMQVQVPQGVGAGMPFQVQVPAAAPAAVAAAAAVVTQPMMSQQPQVGMAQQPQMMQMQPGMQQPGQVHQVAGSDYRMLAAFGDLFIKQQIEMLEAFTGFETENKYDIFAAGGTQHLFHAAEQSDCCARQCCGPNREFKMVVFGPGGPAHPMITIMRPFKFRSPCCCNLQKVSIYAGTEQGQLLGVIREQWSLEGARLDLEVNGRTEFQIQGPCCVCDGACCGDQIFNIVDPMGGPIATPGGNAEIRKMGAKDLGSMVQQQFTKADNFGAVFPISASAEAKALILASVFLIDFMFFENPQDNSQHRHNNDW